jgi:ABC-type multidrug transport system fused ATPase/permease subunit
MKKHHQNSDYSHESQSILRLLICLWRHVRLQRRKHFCMLLALMVLTSFAEILSIGAVLPFLGVLTAPEHFFDLPPVRPFTSFLGLNEPKELLFILTVSFGLAVVLAGVMRLLLLWASTKLAFATGAELSLDIYQRTLYQPYAVHCSRNSSDVISGISSKINETINIISMVLVLISSTAMLIIILIALLYVNALTALIVFGGFGLLYLVIIRLTRKKLLSNSQFMARESTYVIKALQEGLGGIRDVLIDGTQDIYCQVYKNADLSLRRAQASSSFIGGSPRYIMEALGMLLIALIAYSISQKSDGISMAIPILGTLALGAQRLLPVLQQAYGAWSGIRGGQISLEDTIRLLDQPLPEYLNQAQPNEQIPFTRSIRLNQLSFSYASNLPNVIKNISLTIPKGSRIGFIGTTGSGKSTLLDIVMGLLKPTSGSLEIDDNVITQENYRAWQAHISHVPQSIFLTDSTIEENIAFGVPRHMIDLGRVKKAAREAQISESIESWPEQYKTVIGERGVRLSGGQRQRIGIARALYKQSDVIIFDEATSSLDSTTEQAVMESIEQLSDNLTLLIIAHRTTTLKNCNQIIEISDGIVKSINCPQQTF